MVLALLDTNRHHSSIWGWIRKHGQSFKEDEIKVDSVSVFVNGTIQILPLAFDLDVSFIDAPAVLQPWLPEVTQPFLDLRRIPLTPEVDRCVVERDAALSHHFFQIAVTDALLSVQFDTPQDDFTLRMTPFEVIHPSKFSGILFFCNGALLIRR